ncbi:hypothetical protein C0J52_05096 [Blattella germanica]|nr:hypothetical protein C0J52_05096 [Blattella germanica]
MEDEWGCGSAGLPSDHPARGRATHALLPSESGALRRQLCRHQQDAPEHTAIPLSFVRLENSFLDQIQHFSDIFRCCQTKIILSNVYRLA